MLGGTPSFDSEAQQDVGKTQDERRDVGLDSEEQQTSILRLPNQLFENKGFFWQARKIALRRKKLLNDFE